MEALDKSDLKAANERVVLSLIHREPGISRNAIAKRTGLSPAAVTGISARLIEAGLLREERSEAAEAKLGRRPTSLFVIPSARYAVGIEITTSGATLALADLSGAVVRSQEQAPLESVDKFLRAIHDRLGGMVREAPGPVLGVGVSVPGTMDPKTERVVTSTHLHWRDVDAMGILRPGIQPPAFWENNSNLSALAQRWFRPAASQALDHFVFVTLRDGLGTGLIVNGALATGARAHAGEFGHTILVPGGRRCDCGNYGCWEQYASDAALIQEYGGEDGATSLEIARRAMEGEERAATAVRTVARHLGLGLATVVMSLNPSAVALDDFAAEAWPIVEPEVWEGLKERVPAYWREGLEIFPSTETPLRGAIAAVLSRYFDGSLGSVISGA